ncbi:hypothetical protein ACFP56_17390 [Paenibacillus septentrionalis]|uniref:Uncharacterized protein n=1 Tax=Paenibacillus septentrionalis TaxID=429342 RepID=A0ABW1VA88_9BACL
MPIRQIGICSLVFLATILICAAFSFYSQQYNKTQRFLGNWSSTDQLKAHSTSTPFFPRQYVRILPNLQKDLETPDHLQ